MSVEERPAKPDRLTADSSVTTADIREELARVLAGHEFRSSKRGQDFLKYVVEHAVAGHAEYLKERTIGMEVFDRPATYEPSEDAIVRVKASEVRRRLGMYYSEEGATDSVRIWLPPGSYVPEFRRNSLVPPAPHQEIEKAANPPAGAPPVAPELPAISEVNAIPSRASWRIWEIAVAVGCLALLCLVGAGVWHKRHPAPAALLDFWAPALLSKKQVSIFISNVPVYGLTSDPDAKSLQVKDFQLVPDQFVATGDLNAGMRISDMLTGLHQLNRLKIGEASFQDLKNSPSVLVGFSYTKWDEIGKGFRYSMDLGRQPYSILDRGQPTKWAISGQPDDPSLKVDYAVVSRVFDPETNSFLIEISGISHYGTAAAAEFVTRQDLLERALRKVPRDWPSKNLQLVLSVKIISGVATSPEVIATYAW